MVGDLGLPRDRSEPPLAHELGEQLGVVDHLVAAAEIRVLVRERVEAVRTARDDLRHARLAERRHVLLRERLEDVLVPHPPRRVAGARLSGPEDREVDPRRLEQLRRRLGGDACALVERGGAADPVEDLRRRVAGLEHPHAESLGPGRPVDLRLPPRVRRRARRRAASLRLGGEAGLDHDEMAAEVDDVVDVLDRDRALVDARAAGDAVPDHLLRDAVADDRRQARRRRVRAAPPRTAGRGRP